MTEEHRSPMIPAPFWLKLARLIILAPLVFFSQLDWLLSVLQPWHSHPEEPVEKGYEKQERMTRRPPCAPLVKNN